MSKGRYRGRQSYYTVDEAFERAMWLHWVGDDKGANRQLVHIINYIEREDGNGKAR